MEKRVFDFFSYRRSFDTIRTLFWGCLASLVWFKQFFSRKKYYNWDFKGLIFLCPGETFTVCCHRTGPFLHIYNTKHPKVYLFSLLGYVANKKSQLFINSIKIAVSLAVEISKLVYSFSTNPKTVTNAYFGYYFCIWLKIGTLHAFLFWRSLQNICNHKTMKSFGPNHAFFWEKSIFFKRFPGTSHFKRCPKKYENFKKLEKLSLL